MVMLEWCCWCSLLLAATPVQSLLSIESNYQRPSPKLLLSSSAAASSPNAPSHLPQVNTPTATSYPTSLYIHIPFCRQRCRYCDFAIVPVGSTFRETATTTDLEATYLEAILVELRQTLQDHPRTVPLETIYFGGGTPSLAQASTILAILDCIREHCPISDDVEITMEMDPGTFDAPYLETLVRQGDINRVSLGVQAADDTVLASLGRTHRRADVDAAVALLQATPSCEVSIDLMTGVPGVSLALWMDCLATAVNEWRPNHLSVYDLQVEPGTAFGRWYDEANNNNPPSSSPSHSRPPLPTPQEAAAAYQYTAAYLRHHGWDHYEVSSYATRHACRSRHNQAYWQQNGARWYAVGLGATSCSTTQQRHRRPRAMADYITWVHRDQCNDSLLEVDGDNGDVDDYWMDVVLRRLRTSDGLDLTIIEDAAVVQAIEEGAALALELGLAYYCVSSDQHRLLRLSDPQGFLFSNTILSSIVMELERRHQHG